MKNTIVSSCDESARVKTSLDIIVSAVLLMLGLKLQNLTPRPENRLISKKIGKNETVVDTEKLSLDLGSIL